jgi:hypothetical protein
MISPLDTWGIRQDMQGSRGDYRPVWLVYPNVTSGSGYDPFTDSQFDITAPASSFGTVTFTTYEARARIKIITAETVLAMGYQFAGAEVGDYILMFRNEDRDQILRVIANEHGYIYVDGVTLRPDGANIAGVARADDVMVSAKKYAPKLRATGL